MFPTSLLVLVCVLAVGFVVSLSFAILTQKRSHIAYKKFGTMDSPSGKSHAGIGGTGAAGAAVYQSSARADYAIPSQNNVVTYCVIDDRLVDQ